MSLTSTCVFKGSHLSRRNTQLKVEEGFYWPTLISDVQRIVDACPQCSHLRKKDATNPSEDTDAVSGKIS